MTPAVEARGLRKQYGSLVGVDDLTFAVPASKDLSSYVIYVGYDPQGAAATAKTAKKKPATSDMKTAAKSKPKSKAPAEAVMPQPMTPASTQQPTFAPAPPQGQFAPPPPAGGPNG